MRNYKTATPKTFNDRLMSVPFFKTSDNWKWIPTVYKMLLQIACWNRKDKQTKLGISDIPRVYFSNLFGSSYGPIIGSLEGDLLTIYRVNRGIKGLKNYGYTVTDKCLTLLADSTKQYLYTLLTDKKAVRRNQKQISKRGYNRKQYGDIRDYVKTVIDNIDITPDLYNQVETHIATYDAAEKLFIRCLLISIEEKTYGDLKFNDSDGRLPNPYTQLPADIKSMITIAGFKQIVVGDIRSCYPSLWVNHIQRLFPDLDVADEQLKYERIFLNYGIDPKSLLANRLNIPITQIKEVLIAYFNGKGFNRQNKFYISNASNPYYKFNEWLKTEFPKLYSAWLTTDTSQTGNQIGKFFETKLMLHPSIYNRAKDLGLVIGYENDGFSIYGLVDANHPNVQNLLKFVREQSSALLGVPIVFITKEQFTDSERFLIKHHTKRVEQIHGEWIAYCRRFFSDQNHNQLWTEFQNKKAVYQNKMEFHLQYIPLC